MTGAQKAFAAPPGISPICVNARTKKYMNENPPNHMYYADLPVRPPCNPHGQRRPYNQP